MEKNQNKFQTSNVIYQTIINCVFTSNLLAQFSRQIVNQILGMASPKATLYMNSYLLFQ
jgi:hypothetical protein